MKRIMGILAGAVTLAVSLYVTGSLGTPAYGQQPGAQLRTRIALINMGMVFKNYSKWKTTIDELKRSREEYTQKAETLKSGIVERQKALQDASLDSAKRDQYEHDIKTLQRQIQDLADDAKQKIGKYETTQAVQTFHEIQEAATTYAKNYDIDLVLFYTDGAGPDANNPFIVGRKLENGACMPLYMAPGMDITGAVTDMLNRNLGSAGTGSTNQ